MHYFLSILFFTFYLFGFDYHLKPYKLNEGINCFFGLPSKVTKDNEGNMINSCYIETENGYIVIDSGPTYSYAQSTYAIMEKKKKLPVMYVINTSSSEAHILGNSFFKEQGSTLIGPKDYKKYSQKNYKLSMANNISRDVFVNTRLIKLDNYLKDDLSILLGKLKIDIKKIKNDDGHLIVYIPSKKIVFAGDMIFNNRLVAFKENRSIVVWQKGLELLKSLSWVDIVSAHGYMTRRSALRNTENYLSLLKSEVENAILKGASREEVIQRVNLPSFSEDRLYTLWHPQNVASVYDELVVSTKKTPPVVKHKIAKVDKVATKKKPLHKKVVKPKVKKKTIKKRVSKVEYVSLPRAIKQARSQKKIIFIKVRSTTCKYCDELDGVIAKDNNVKRILNKYFEVVSINTDYEEVPYNIRIESTPTLLFMRPNSHDPLMNLTGIEALGEFMSVLKELVIDGHNGGYLKL